MPLSLIFAIMASENAPDTASPTPILVYGIVNRLDFISAYTRSPIKSFTYPDLYAYNAFNDQVFVVQPTGQVDIYDKCTQTLLESFSASGLGKLSPLLVFPTRLFCLDAGYFLDLEKRVWERVKLFDPAYKGYGQTCTLEGCTYAIVSELRPGPVLWCWNCQNEEENFIYQSDLLDLQGASILRKLPVDLPYGREVPFLLAYPPNRIVFVGGGRARKPETGIYLYDVVSMKLQLLGRIDIQASWVRCACLAQDRLYAVYGNGSFLNVSLATGIGWLSNGELLLFLWFASKKLPRLSVILLSVILKEYLHIQRLRF